MSAVSMVVQVVASKVGLTVVQRELQLVAVKVSMTAELTAKSMVESMVGALAAQTEL